MDLLASLGLNGQEAEENAVSYALYIDAALMGEGSCDALLALRVKCVELLQSYLADYIWQRDRFEFHTSIEEPPPWTFGKRKRGAPAPAVPEPPCLWGTLRFGDNIEDEWFTVWLLLEITRQLRDVSAKVFDNDGEFLLIEAAYALPRWVKPESARNRVWLRGGQLHILPLPSSKHPDLPTTPTTQQALQIMAGGRCDTHHPKVQAAIDARLSGYPQAARANMHRARAYVPYSVARVLTAEPQMVAAVVDAFCHRDMEDMRSASRMRRFPPTDMVQVMVTLNRCQYAQLAQQRFEPPRGYPATPPVGHPLHKASTLGLKLAAGLEVLYTHSSATRRPPPAKSSAATSSATASAPLDATPAASSAASAHASTSSADVAPVESTTGLSGVEPGLAHSPAWQAYLTSLERVNYFQGNRAGSAQYRVLLSAAAKSFAASAEYAAVSEHLSRPAERIDELLSATAPSALPPVTGAEDDDSWLEAMAGTLEEELARRTAEVGQPPSSSSAGRPAGSASGGSVHQTRQSAQAPVDEGSSGEEGEEAAAAAREVDASELAGPLRGFVEYLASGVEGAEVPHGGRDRRDGRDTDVALDPSAFLAELKNALGGLAGALGGDKVGSGEGAGGGVRGRTAGPGGAVGTATAGRTGQLTLDDEHDDDLATSSTEGSSFFSDDDRSSGTDDGDDDDDDMTRGEDGDMMRTSSSGQDRRDAGMSVKQPVQTGTGAAVLSAQRAAGSGGNRRTPPGVANGRAAAMQEAWEVKTATDSDDDEDGDSDSEGSRGGADAASLGSGGWDGGGDASSDADGGDDDEDNTFMEAYSRALEQQLRDTKMAETFERVDLAHVAPGLASGAQGSSAPTGRTGATGGVPPVPSSTASAGAGSLAGGEAVHEVAQAEEGLDEGGCLMPVDLDMNLVKNLIRSYTSQQGLPGPAGSLAALMGLQLPQGDIE